MSHLKISCLWYQLARRTLYFRPEDKPERKVLNPKGKLGKEWEIEWGSLVGFIPFPNSNVNFKVSQDKKNYFLWDNLHSQLTSGPQSFWHQGLASWKTIFPWTRVGGLVSAWVKYVTFIVHCISIIIPSAPPQIIRPFRFQRLGIPADYWYVLSCPSTYLVKPAGVMGIPQPQRKGFWLWT